MAKRPKPPTLEQAFGLALREERTRQEISQEELGFRSGAHRTYISEIERGVKTPTLSTIGRLARALGVRASALVRSAEESAGIE